MLLKHLSGPTGRYFMHAPDTDESGSGGGVSTAETNTDDDENPPAPPAKTFTEAEVNKREAALRRRYERENRELKAEQEKLKKDLEEIKKAAGSGSGSKPRTAEEEQISRDEAGRIELLEKRFNRQIEELNSKLGAAEDAAAKEKETRLRLERDSALQAALVHAQVEDKHKVAATRYFLPQIKWDDLDNQWAFETRAGNLVTIEDGVLEELPDFFKPSRMRNGGAGTSSGGGALAIKAKHKELEEAKKKLDELAKATRRSGGRDLTEYTKQKRRVAELQAQLGKK